VAVGAAGAVPTTAPAEASPHREFGARVLTTGMTGRDVRVLQDFLSRAGVGTPVDGRFGAGTRKRVRMWERRRLRAAGASSGQRVAGAVRLDGRLTRREARLLRADVAEAESDQAPRAAEPAAGPPPAGAKATIGPDGRAVAPADAPEAVKQIIAAGNEIHDLPYRYGGGHKPSPNKDSGYDCSGSMSYAFRAPACSATRSTRPGSRGGATPGRAGG
jgi:cell wall-associated NlpC family hydrolase